MSSPLVFDYETPAPYPRKRLIIRRVDVEDYAKVLDFVCSTFVRDEPTLALLGHSQALEDDMRRLVGPMLDDGLSLLAENVEDDEIVGVWIAQHHTKATQDYNSHTTLRSHAARAYLKMLEEAGRKADFSHKLGRDNFVHMFAVAVDKAWRGQGIASEMLKRALEIYKTEGFYHVVVHCTNPETRDIMVRNGFVTLAEMDFSNLLNFDDEPEFKEKSLCREHYVAVYAKLVHPHPQPLHLLSETEGLENGN